MELITLGNERLKRLELQVSSSEKKVHVEIHNIELEESGHVTIITMHLSIFFPI